MALGLASVFATAWRLTPDPRGIGTHEQLGLPPCPILTTTGRPCPACGLTTSFAWLARADLARSARAHPAGPALAAIGLLAIPWLLVASTTGRAPFLARPAPTGPVLMAGAVIAAAVVALGGVARRMLSP